MADEAEKKLDAKNIQQPPEAVARPAVIRTKEEELIWECMNARHILGKDESATDLLCITDKKSKLEIIDEKKPKQREDISQSGILMAIEADTNPVMQPVAKLREHADQLPEGREKEKMTALSRDLAVDLSPVMREHYDWKNMQIAQVHRDGETLEESLKRLHPSDKEIPPGAKPGVNYFNILQFVERAKVQDAAAAAPHLDQTLKELLVCKWANDIHVWKRNPIEFTDYNPKNSRIEIDSQQSEKRQIEVLAHEGYHATHQDLDLLYAGQAPIIERAYVDIKMRQEAGAFLREIQVNEELRQNRPELGNKPTEYMWVDAKDSKDAPRKQIMNELLVRERGKVNEQKSLEAINKFLREHPAARGNHNGIGYMRNLDGTLATNDYIRNYKQGYELYSLPENFKMSKEKMLQKNYI